MWDALCIYQDSSSDVYEDWVNILAIKAQFSNYEIEAKKI
jgi:hypothetical protein